MLLTAFYPECPDDFKYVEWSLCKWTKLYVAQAFDGHPAELKDI